MAVEYRRWCQHPLEARRLREWVKDADSILEIGSRFGDNLVFMAVSMKGNYVVSVDYPDAEGYEWGNVVKMELKRNIMKLTKGGFNTAVIFGDSHTDEVFREVCSKMPAGGFDVIMIDGDHSYEGSKQDYFMYRNMGKTILFHDINPEGGWGVSQLWKELEGQKEEYIAPGSKMGIGKIINEERN